MTALYISPDRRHFLGVTASALATLSFSRPSLGKELNFSPSDVEALAEVTSRQPSAPTNYMPPPPLGSIGYDEYRDIRFRPEYSVWRDATSHDVSTSLQFFLSSYIYPERVEINLVEGNVSRSLAAAREMFDFGALTNRVPEGGEFAFSGFRVHGPLNHGDVADEVVAFKGASYFRALGKGHTYGLSARGLAINTIGTEAEEFPRFTKFWIEKPEAFSRICIHALLDSKSITGAYHFTLLPGSPTVMDVEVTLFPRVALRNVGLAPLTSMFLFDSRNRNRFRDFRDAVHDSDGLVIARSDDETGWRPLLNPSSIQTSTFSSQSPRGFGLVQRKRKYEEYYDLEARYEARPSSWVEPVGDWGQGSVKLLELPIGAEWGDNIVAYWQPSEPLEARQRFQYAYRLYWSDEAPRRVSRVTQTRIGGEEGKPMFVVDFEGQPNIAELPEALAATSAGTVSSPVVQNNPHDGGVRCVFTLDPKGAPSADLQLSLSPVRGHGHEVWHYRWTP
jgi:glucans biosynthesis protein